MTRGVLRSMVAAVVGAGLFVSACSPSAVVPTLTPAAKSAPAATPASGGVLTGTAPAATPAGTVPPASSPTTTQAAVPKPTGELKVAIASFGGGGFDPIVSGQFGFQMVAFGVYDPLIWLTPDGKDAPGIAERWEMSPDGKTWTFYIRKGVKFHDGSDLTGEDVKFSIDRGMSDQSTYVDTPFWKSAIERVELKDPYTVVVNLKSPQGELWQGMNGLGVLSAIVPKKYIEAKGVDYFRANPVGSGPWKVVKYDLNNYLELEAVGNWRAMPQFKTVKITAVPEEGTRVAMLKTGDVDLAEITTDSASGLKGAAGIQVLSYSAGDVAGTPLYYDITNPAKYPVSNKQVRKALSLAINRQELANNLFSGYGKPAAVYYVQPGAYFYDANVLKPDPYDPDQAKKLLADAGFANGFTLKFYSVAWSPWMPNLNQAIAGYWDKVGVKTEMIPIDYAALRPHIFPQQKPELWGTAGGATTWSGSGAFGFKLLTPYQSQTGGMKNHNNAELNALIDKTMATVDPAERKKLALQATVMAKEERSVIPSLDVPRLWAAGKTVGGWKPLEGTLAVSAFLETVTHAK